MQAPNAAHSGLAAMHAVLMGHPLQSHVDIHAPMAALEIRNCLGKDKRAIWNAILQAAKSTPAALNPPVVRVQAPRAYNVYNRLAISCDGKRKAGETTPQGAAARKHTRLAHQEAQPHPLTVMAFATDVLLTSYNQI